MKKFFLAVIISLLATSAIAQTPPEEPEKKEKNQRLGLRGGYVSTTSGIRNTFGDGMNLALHWMWDVNRAFSMDFTIGAFYLGSTSRSDITFQAFRQSFDDQTMRILNFTAAPTLNVPLGGKTRFMISAGAGPYTVSLLLDEAFNEFDFTDNHLGVNAGVVLMRRVSENWFIDIGVQAHKIWTSDKQDDLFFIYSEGDQDPLFYNVSVGFMISLF
jgi:hypothetical protein